MCSALKKLFADIFVFLLIGGRSLDNGRNARCNINMFLRNQKRAGGHSEGKTRESIPNSAVKALSADGTWVIFPGRVGHRQD